MRRAPRRSASQGVAVIGAFLDPVQGEAGDDVVHGGAVGVPAPDAGAGWRGMGVDDVVAAHADPVGGAVVDAVDPALAPGHQAAYPVGADTAIGVEVGVDAVGRSRGGGIPGRQHAADGVVEDVDPVPGIDTERVFGAAA